MEAKALPSYALVGSQPVVDERIDSLRRHVVRRDGRIYRWIISLLSIMLCLGVWQWASMEKWSTFIHFENIPAPTVVAHAALRLFEAPGFQAHIASSVQRIFSGFAIAAVLAVGIGLLVGRFRLASAAFLPPLELMRPIPAVAWIPLAILMFSTAEQSIVSITFIGAFFPILLNTIHGVESIDKRLVQASLSLGAGPIDVFTEVILPGSLPSIITGLSIGMGTSWFSLITAEMISGQFGIGYFTWESYSLQDYPNIILGMISIGLLGMLSSGLIRLIGHKLMPWFGTGARA